MLDFAPLLCVMWASSLSLCVMGDFGLPLGLESYVCPLWVVVLSRWHGEYLC